MHFFVYFGSVKPPTAHKAQDKNRKIQLEWAECGGKTFHSIR